VACLYWPIHGLRNDFSAVVDKVTAIRVPSTRIHCAVTVQRGWSRATMCEKRGYPYGNIRNIFRINGCVGKRNRNFNRIHIAAARASRDTLPHFQRRRARWMRICS
jgi:hypothetical protein